MRTLRSTLFIGSVVVVTLALGLVFSFNDPTAAQAVGHSPSAGPGSWSHGADAEAGMCPLIEPETASAPWEARPSRFRTCRCSCGAPCQTNADCGPGGTCSAGITCC
jgi:hypothetical protein